MKLSLAFLLLACVVAVALAAPGDKEAKENQGDKNGNVEAEKKHDDKEAVKGAKKGDKRPKREATTDGPNLMAYLH